ncbi:hypothetical protein [Nonomuraea sediminis]|uniref:hypothetical protein n=1 Tax=Nonomuraea sediminis TaxID=2835864 RepID=UPI001BDD4812|nr:hypothetical protein [Nonomuraea sediminis]
MVEPIRRSVTVRSDRDHVFDAFVREIGQWWPTHPLSIGGGERVVKVLVEERLDGRVYEVWDDLRGGVQRRLGHGARQVRRALRA